MDRTVAGQAATPFSGAPGAPEAGSTGAGGDKRTPRHAAPPHDWHDTADSVRLRLALLNRASEEIGTTLDLVRTAEELVAIAIPDFADTTWVLLQERVATHHEIPAPLKDGGARVRRLALGVSDKDPLPVEFWLSTLPIGETAVCPPASPFARCMAERRSLFFPIVPDELAGRTAEDFGRPDFYRAMAGRSLLLSPLMARGRVLGLLAFNRDPDGAGRVLRPGRGAGGQPGAAHGAVHRQRAAVQPGEVAGADAAEFAAAQTRAAPAGDGGRAPVRARQRRRGGRRRLVRRDPADRRPGGAGGRGRDGARDAGRHGDGAAAHGGADAGPPGPAGDRADGRTWTRCCRTWPTATCSPRASSRCTTRRRAPARSCGPGTCRR